MKMSDEQATKVIDKGTDYWICPVCGYNDGYINIGATHYFFCHEHKTIWPIGEGLFSSWLEEDNTIWEENMREFGHYKMAGPIVKDNPAVEADDDISF
jgi:hypothetical protein